MCDFSQGFKLCTCATDALPETDAPIVYIWQLSTARDIRPINQNIRGIYISPLQDLGAGLHEEFVWTELNSKNCFDFDYQPSEGDHLELRAEFTKAGYAILKQQFADRKAKAPLQHPAHLHTGRMEFIFRDGYWEIDALSPLEYDLSRSSQGKIEPQLKQP